MNAASVTYKTLVIGDGNHASLAIPDEILAALGANRRAPLKITVNNHTYRSTATAVAGECRVVFPQADRALAGAAAGDEVTITLELESGHRVVELPAELARALAAAGLTQMFEAQSYSKRREFARQVESAKSLETQSRRIEKIVAGLTLTRG